MECLIKLHFNDTRKEIYLWKIKALKTEVKINKERKNIINHLYLGDSEQKHFSMLGENLAKTIVDIYSINKYPYLTEVDRDSLLHELYENLNGFMSDHSRTIEIANDIRNSEDEQIKEMPIEQIILEY
ncbi:hypothetical protein A9498_28655 [Bacillus thuringiensis serovar coreanensis]|nr:hypothetical protein A9498_28655 [Bacillus thuringiensis serovar coreanensis]